MEGESWGQGGPDVGRTKGAEDGGSPSKQI